MLWYDESKEGEGGAEGIPETIVAEEDTRFDSVSGQIHVDDLSWFINLIKSLRKEEESVETVVK